MTGTTNSFTSALRVAIRAARQVDHTGLFEVALGVPDAGRTGSRRGWVATLKVAVMMWGFAQ